MVPRPLQPGRPARDSWGLIYHLLMSTYGWTIEQVNDLTMPQLYALLDEIAPPRTEAAPAPVRNLHPDEQDALSMLSDHVVEDVVPQTTITGRTGRPVKVMKKSDATV